MTVEIVDLGTWGAASLLAEYDPASDAIRVNARAVDAVRRALGEGHARCFTTVAIAHEAHHRAHPHASEAEVRAAVASATGIDAGPYERVVRAARAPE